MRALALPAAVLLSLCLYMPFPALREKFAGFLLRIYDSIVSALDNKQIDRKLALSVYLLLLSAAAALLSALHPLLCAVITAPLFTFSAVMPGCAKAKDELDSGKYARDIPAYEAIVRENCLSLAPAFLEGCFAPLLLIAAGTPLYLGAALGYAHAALCALSPQDERAKRMLSSVHRAVDKVFSAMLMLCAGLVGRNPLRIHAKTARERLIRTLGVAGDRTDTHAPMSGDIAQGIFVCSFAAGLLCVMLTLVLLALC